MTLNMSGMHSSSSCNDTDSKDDWNNRMEKMYTVFYLLLFIPGLLLNTTALWVLCKHISKRTKAVIFMINLSVADLAHILSLPLRIYYYFNHIWPFGHGMCLFCFYLKYLNMYAAIAFLVCISMQRCVFLLDPFCARRWRRRYDVLISFIVWVVVGLGCSPFILMRSSGNSTQSVELYANMSYASTQRPITSTTSSPNSTGPTCFKDLPMRRLPHSLAAVMMTLAELFGFVIPLTCICYSSIRIAHSLYEKKNPDDHNNSSSARNRTLSVTSTDKYETNSDKRRALQMVLACTVLFLFCFAPYHLNFLLYLMVMQGIVTDCTTREVVLHFHPVSLCLASLSCCLNPLLYYFLTAEFRSHLSRRPSSITSTLISSPSISQRTAMQRMTSMESAYSG